MAIANSSRVHFSLGGLLPRQTPRVAVGGLRPPTPLQKVGLRPPWTLDPRWSQSQDSPGPTGPWPWAQGHPGWAGTLPGQAWLWAQKKNPGIFFTGTGLVDPVRDRKFPGDSLMGTGENQKSGLPEAPGPGILAWTLPQKKNPWDFFFSYRVK